MPHADDESLEEVPESSTARIALISIFYILLASIQYFYKKYILENLGWGKLNQFIDLCSVSNVSYFSFPTLHIDIIIPHCRLVYFV